MGAAVGGSHPGLGPVALKEGAGDIAEASTTHDGRGMAGGKGLQQDRGQRQSPGQAATPRSAGSLGWWRPVGSGQGAWRDPNPARPHLGSGRGWWPGLGPFSVFKWQAAGSQESGGRPPSVQCEGDTAEPGCTEGEGERLRGPYGLGTGCVHPRPCRPLLSPHPCAFRLSQPTAQLLKLLVSCASCQRRREPPRSPPCAFGAWPSRCTINKPAARPSTPSVLFNRLESALLRGRSQGGAQ